MSTIEPSIKIVRNDAHLVSIEVVMPIRIEKSFDGSLKIHMPLFHTQTWARDEADVEIAVEQSVKSFCKVAEKFGQGLEKELQAMGWIIINDKTNEPALEFDIRNIDAALNRILRTSKRSFNKNLELT